MADDNASKPESTEVASDFVPCMGLETEYGIKTFGDSNSVGSRLVLLDAATRTDAFRSSPNATHMWLPNGARLYQDIGDHPEYATPEVDDARKAVIWIAAGDALLAQCCDAVSAQLRSDLGDDDARVMLLKNNVDGKGVTYGTHENHLVPRRITWDALTEALAPFFATRSIFTGAGRVGFGAANGSSRDFQIFQRADYLMQLRSGGTTSHRPLINTRDEPHSNKALWRRLHVTFSDANLCQTATFLKIGTLQLVLRLIADGKLDNPARLRKPLEAMRGISRDPSCTAMVQLDPVGKATAVEIQRYYLDLVKRAARNWDLSDVERDVLAGWSQALDAIERDPMELFGKIDWVTKRKVLEDYTIRARDNGVDEEQIGYAVRALDLRYHDISARGIHNMLLRRGAIDEIVTQDQIAAAILEPPTTTRAWFRGKCVQHFSEELRAVDWSKVLFKAPPRTDIVSDPPTPRPKGVTIEMPDPREFTAAALEGLFDEVQSAAEIEAWIAARS